MQIDHINIKAPGLLLEQVRDFYCTVLGLEEGFRPDFASEGHWLYAESRPLVHLSLGLESPAAGTPSCLDHVAFRARDLQGFLQRLDAAEVAYRAHYIDELGLTQLFFRDPAGTGLEVNFQGEVLP